MTTVERRLLRIRGRARAGSEMPRHNAPAVHASSDAAEVAVDCRRASPRVRVRSDILLRQIGGFNFQVGLQDVSTGGCRVELVDQSEVGESMIARFPQLEPLGARVCWAEGNVAGVQFATTIHPAVFDHLLTRLTIVRSNAE